MLREDEDASELRDLLLLACPVVGSAENERPLPLPSVPPDATTDLATDLSSARKPPAPSKCFRPLKGKGKAGD